MATVTHDVARRPRAYVRVQGPDAVDYLNRMLSNDVPDVGSIDALLLTPKARVIAPVLVWRRGDDDVLLLTEPELGDTLLVQLRRMRFAAKCDIEPEEHVSAIVLGEHDGIPNRDYGVPAVEVLDSGLDGDADLERLRIEAGTPLFGREIDDRAISFTKGCYPGQEPVARQRYRGKVNRRLRVLEVQGAPEPETPVVHAGKEVGRITSAVDGLALAYVRVEVPDNGDLEVGGAPARLHWPTGRP
jgi:folate-binding protein YgfZ